jgi:nucleoid DNA-binding protein
MNTRFTIMDLAQALARRANLPYADAAAFVRQFFETIQDALLREKIVKVRGFGTFKLISVEARESVSVADGSRIQIAGHTKVSFTPDAVLRDAVNKPFAEFETVILSDSLDIAALEALDAEVPAEEVTPKDVPAEDVPAEDVPAEEGPVVSEAKIEVVETVAAVPVEEPAVPVEEEEEVATPEDQEEEPAVSVEEEEEVATAEELEEEPTVSVEEEVEPVAPEVKEESEAKPEEPVSVKVVEPVPVVVVEPIPLVEPAKPENKIAEPMAPVKSETPRCSSSWRCFLAFLLALLLFIVGYCVGYLRPVELPFLTAQTETTASEQATAKQPSAKQQPAKKPAPAAPAASKDSIAAKADSTAAAKPTVPAKAPSETLAYPQLEGGEYWIVGIKGTEIMKPGCTLLNFSLKYYKSKDFVNYICVMNGIKNPDIVPLNKELKIPELRKK